MKEQGVGDFPSNAVTYANVLFCATAETISEPADVHFYICSNESLHCTKTHLERNNVIKTNFFLGKQISFFLLQEIEGIALAVLSFAIHTLSFVV